MLKTSVILCTYNRAHLLKRSLLCYTRQSLKNFELIILDDNSQDETGELIADYKDKLHIKYLKLEDKKPDEWRDAACIINRGIKIAGGDFIYITHPEVMPCFDCLEKFNGILDKNPLAYVNSRTYYLTGDMQEKIDTVNWKEDFYSIKSLPAFYDLHNIDKFLDYDKDALCEDINRKYNSNYKEIPIPFGAVFAESVEIFDSWVLGGMKRKAWKEFGGLNEYKSWGAVDVDFIERRKALGIVTISPKDIYVLHQNHDVARGKYLPTNRSLKPLKEEYKEKFYKKENFLADMEV